MDGLSSEIHVEIPERFVAHLDAAILRFESLNPDLTVEIVGAGCRLSGVGANRASVRSQFLQALYREKIYADGLSMRRALIETLGA